MGSPRAAMALYLALALHLLVALLIALAPTEQHPAGPGRGMGLGLQLSGADSVLPQAVRVAESPAPAPDQSGPLERKRIAVQSDARARPSGAEFTANPASSHEPRHTRPRPRSSNRSDNRQATHDGEALYPANSGGAQRGGGGPDRYLASLRQHLQAFRRVLPPGTAPGETEVRFVVSVEGRLESLDLLRSSGRAELDAEALDLLRRSQPLPPPPDSSSLHLAVTILID